ncbi:MAG: hypothetical protein QXK37_00175 [Candidatus Woesearchaeota archaeon]
MDYVGKIKRELTLAALFFYFFIMPAMAEKLTVEKLVENPDNISVDSDVVVLLKFKNPYGREVPIKIVDKNLLGNNGYDIQCLEYTLPKDKEIVLALAAIQPYQEGVFVLSKAQITYQNPETGKNEQIESNEYTVEVKKGKSSFGNAQGITTVYQCGGQNIKSTSFSSSGSSMQVSITQGFQSSQQTMQQALQQASSQKAQQDSQRSTQERITHALQQSQLTQDAQAIKQEMQRIAQQREEQRQQLSETIEKNRGFQEMHNQLTQQGYLISAKDITPTGNNSGSFKYIYRNDNGTSAEIAGRVEQDELRDIHLRKENDENLLRSVLANSKKFKSFSEQLANEGYNETRFDYIVNGNRTNIHISYEDKNGNKANISAVVQNATVTEVVLQKKNKSNLSWLLIFLSLLFVLLLLVFAVLQKKKSTPPQQQNSVSNGHVKSIDPLAEALKKLKEAESSYIKEPKEAFAMISEALRFYYSNVIGDGSQLNATETIMLLKKNKLPISGLQQCLSICGFIEFANYKPEEKDFKEALRLAHMELHRNIKKR